MGYPPFWDEDQKRLYAQIKSAKYEVLNITVIHSWSFELRQIGSLLTINDQVCNGKVNGGNSGHGA